MILVFEVCSIIELNGCYLYGTPESNQEVEKLLQTQKENYGND